MTISVLLIDDDSFHRQGLRTFLQLNQFQVEEADNAEAGLMMASQQDFGAAVVDIRLPQTQGARPTHHPTGIALARAIKERQPALGIVLLSAYENYSAEIADLVRDGIRGLAYKVKGCLPDDLISALHDTMIGKVHFDREVADPVILRELVLNRLDAGEREWLMIATQHLGELSPREQQIADLIAASHSVAGIAQRLSLTDHHVQNTITRIYQKLSITELPPEYKKDVLLAKAFLLHQLSS